MIITLSFPCQWSQQGALSCQYQVSVCGFSVGTQSNWLISQHISRQLPSGGLVNHVTVNLDLELNDCNTTQLCRQSVQLYKWEISSVNPTSARNTTSYIKIGEVFLDSTSGTVRSNETIQVELTSEENGFYLAVVDEGTCITVHRIVVFYSVCPSGNAELIIRPETVVPTSRVSGECVDNSSTLDGENPIISCTNESRWEVLHGCYCIPGHEGVDKDAATLMGCSGIIL